MKLKYIIISFLISVTCITEAQEKLIILHTNDTHSRIEAMPSSDPKYANMGGVVNRESIVRKIRNTNENVLLLDAGDFLQGTPYFNLFKGRVEAKAMNLIGYDAVTLGNHEFDYGLDTLKMIIEHLKIPVVNCNYDFSKTPLKNLVKPYVIFKKSGMKIGVIGVGVDPEGMIQKDKYDGMVFQPILESANHYAKMLKDKKRCDVVVCLSHIGYTSSPGVINDVVLAEKSQNIDVIIGGHSHTLLDQPDVRKNIDGKDVLINQLGKNGIYLGQIELELENKK